MPDELALPPVPALITVLPPVPAVVVEVALPEPPVTLAAPPVEPLPP